MVVSVIASVVVSVVVSVEVSVVISVEVLIVDPWKLVESVPDAVIYAGSLTIPSVGSESYLPLSFTNTVRTFAS